MIRVGSDQQNGTDRRLSTELTEAMVYRYCTMLCVDAPDLRFIDRKSTYDEAMMTIPSDSPQRMNMRMHVHILANIDIGDDSVTIAIRVIPLRDMGGSGGVVEKHTIVVARPEGRKLIIQGWPGSRGQSVSDYTCITNVTSVYVRIRPNADGDYEIFYDGTKEIFLNKSPIDRLQPP